MVMHDHGPFICHVFAQAFAFIIVVGGQIVMVIADQIDNFISLLT